MNKPFFAMNSDDTSSLTIFRKRVGKYAKLSATKFAKDKLPTRFALDHIIANFSLLPLPHL